MSNVFRFITPEKSIPISHHTISPTNLTFEKIGKNEVESKKRKIFFKKLIKSAVHVNGIRTNSKLCLSAASV